MKPFVFTPSAEADLFAIWTYIAKDNLEAADQIEATILEIAAKSPPFRNSATSGPI